MSINYLSQPQRHAGDGKRVACYKRGLFKMKNSVNVKNLQREAVEAKFSADVLTFYRTSSPEERADFLAKIQDIAATRAR